MITENLSTLKIHKLSQAQYERELEAGNLDESALYLTPDEEINLSGYATLDQLGTKAYADLSNVSNADVKSKFDSAHIVTATSSDGVAYTATAPGITELKRGIMLIIMPNMTSTATRNVTLNVNGLGDVVISPASGVSTSHYTYPVSNDWMKANSPVLLMYSGIWKALSYPLVAPASIAGTIPISKGGTDATTAEEALENLGGVSLEDVANLHVWAQLASGFEFTLDTETQISFPHYGAIIEYGDSLDVDVKGNVKIHNSQWIEISQEKIDNCFKLIDKYISYVLGGSKYYAYVPSFESVNGTDAVMYVPIQRAIPSNRFVKYVVSINSNAYPADGSQNGNLYKYVGQIGDLLYKF